MRLEIEPELVNGWRFLGGSWEWSEESSNDSTLHGWTTHRTTRVLARGRSPALASSIAPEAEAVDAGRNHSASGDRLRTSPWHAVAVENVSILWTESGHVFRQASIEHTKKPIKHQRLELQATTKATFLQHRPRVGLAIAIATTVRHCQAPSGPRSSHQGLGCRKPSQTHQDTSNRPAGQP